MDEFLRLRACIIIIVLFDLESPFEQTMQSSMLSCLVACLFSNNPSLGVYNRMNHHELI